MSFFATYQSPPSFMRAPTLKIPQSMQYPSFTYASTNQSVTEQNYASDILGCVNIVNAHHIS
jgi:hypothetical protein